MRLRIGDIVEVIDVFSLFYGEKLKITQVVNNIGIVYGNFLNSNLSSYDNSYIGFYYTKVKVSVSIEKLTYKDFIGDK